MSELIEKNMLMNDLCAMCLGEQCPGKKYCMTMQIIELQPIVKEK